MFSGYVSRMSSTCKSAVVLFLLITTSGAKPVGTTLGAGINLFDYLHHLEADSSRKTNRDLLSHITSRSLFLDPVISKWERNKKGEGDKFQLILCDTTQELRQAIDSGFKIAGLDSTIMERNFESVLPTKYQTTEYSYILVRYSRIRHAAKLRAASSLTKEAEEAIRYINREDTSGVLAFFKQFGTHFISSYSSGESVYQVYVYQKETFQWIKLRLKRADTLNPSTLENLMSRYHFDYASPIKSSSKPPLGSTWNSSSKAFLIFRYLEALKNRRLLRQLGKEMDQTEALLTIDLKTMDRAIADSAKKNHFKEVLDNQIQLYESNL